MRNAATPRLIPLLCIGAAILTAQTPPPNPVFHAAANLVQIDAVVTNSKGGHIANLRQEDFTVSEDGNPQKITNFAWIHVSESKSDLRRSIVLMIDDDSMPGSYVMEARNAAKKFVADQIGPNDLVSVMSTLYGLGRYQQFTGDKPLIYAALDRISGKPFFAPSSGGQSLPGGLPGLAKTDGEKLIAFAQGGPSPNGMLRLPGESIFSSIGTLPLAIQGLRDLPGRKAIVYFSNAGFHPAPGLTDLANRSGVVIYDVDPQGDPLGLLHNDTPAQLAARDTGGLWFNRAPGSSIAADMKAILEDMSGYYLIGYLRPDSDESPQIHHDIEVRVNRPELNVRARKGFIGQPESAPDPTTRTLRQALFSPNSVGGIRLRLDPVFAASPPDPKTRKRLPVIRAKVAIDGGDVRFNAADGGNKTLALDFLIGVYDEEGFPVTEKTQTFRLDARPGAAEQLPGNSLYYVIDVALPMPGKFQVRAAVRDAGAGQVGTAYSFIAIPDFNKPGIALSSLALAGSGGAGWNEFAPGATVDFGCEVFGLRLPQKGTPNVEMEVRLLHNGSLVFESPVKPAQPTTMDGETLLAGTIKLASNLDPGDYTMQLVAWDRLAEPKKQMASQQVDLTVVQPPTLPR